MAGDLQGLIAGNRTGSNVVGAILFLQASTNVMDIYSALNSSPWTSENFGADDKKAASCREYVYHSIVWTTFYCGMAAWIAKSWWPIYGAMIGNAYMYWLYERALRRGATAGSQGWSSQS